LNPPVSLGQRLATARALLGLLQTQPSLVLSELCGLCGYDFVILDGEHGTFGERDFFEAIRILEGGNAAAFVRTPNHDPCAIGRYMDMGAKAIVVPNVTTPDEARALVRAMAYPPVGTRGCGAAVHRTTRYGLDPPQSEPVLLLPIIESREGVENAQAILSIEGVDGVIIGPSDLSASLGSAGEFAGGAYAGAFEEIERAARATKKILGAPPHGPYSAAALRARGHTLLILDADMTLISSALSGQVSQARAALAAAD
jgi:4-hydroxy-2-oxoheptanedioate aldolase